VQRTCRAALLAAAAILFGRSMRRTLGGLRQQAGRLTAAVTEGRLAERADAAAVHWEFQPIIQGMNETMDAFVRPIQVTSDYVDRISRGNIPPAIEDTYRGDFGAIKDSLNRCIGAVRVPAEEVGRVIDA